MTNDLTIWLRSILVQDLENVEESRALSPDDLHWSMPRWLDRSFLRADIKAKQAIVEMHLNLMPEFIEIRGVRKPQDPICTTCQYWTGVDEHDSDGEWVAQPWPCKTLLVLAEAYAARPGYREEWRPWWKK